MQQDWAFAVAKLRWVFGSLVAFEVDCLVRWKSFVNARRRVAMGDQGCLSIFGAHVETHSMVAEQLTSEYFIRTEGRGRSADEWKQSP